MDGICRSYGCGNGKVYGAAAVVRAAVLVKAESREYPKSPSGPMATDRQHRAPLDLRALNEDQQLQLFERDDRRVFGTM